MDEYKIELCTKRCAKLCLRCFWSTPLYLLILDTDIDHIQGYTHPREYIVTEWPVVSYLARRIRRSFSPLLVLLDQSMMTLISAFHQVSTCSDLWSLVYDHDCSAVVVLCNPSPGVSNVSPDI